MRQKIENKNKDDGRNYKKNEIAEEERKMDGKKEKKLMEKMKI